MTRRTITAICLFFALRGISAAQITYDTLYSAPAGPGVTYTRLYAPSVPYNVSVLEVDLKIHSFTLKR